MYLHTPLNLHNFLALIFYWYCLEESDLPSPIKRRIHFCLFKERLTSTTTIRGIKIFLSRQFTLQTSFLHKKGIYLIGPKGYIYQFHSSLIHMYLSVSNFIQHSFTHEDEVDQGNLNPTFFHAIFIVNNICERAYWLYNLWRSNFAMAYVEFGACLIQCPYLVIIYRVV